MLEKFRWPQAAWDAADPFRQHLAPHILLRPYIAHYTLYYPQDAAPETLTIIPDASGCLTFTFEGGCAESVFWGASTQAVEVKNSRTPPRLFVEFLPGGAHRLLDMPHHELSDRKIGLTQLDPGLEHSIADFVEAAQDERALTGALDLIFLQRLGQMKEPHPAIPALFWLQGMGKAVPTVRDLALQTSYSERHLGRIVREHLGVGLKTYLRLLRVNRTLLRLQDRQGALTSLAVGTGYFDQAHFIHDFKAICGTTPTDYLKNLSVFYNEPFKF